MSEEFPPLLSEHDTNITKRNKSQNNLEQLIRILSSGGHVLDGNVAGEYKCEASLLDIIVLTYQNEREFSKLDTHRYFVDIFKAAVKFRLCSLEWYKSAPSLNRLRILMLVRILMRDKSYVKLFSDLGGIKDLAEQYAQLTELYLDVNRNQPFLEDIMMETTSILHKLSLSQSQRVCLIGNGVHQPLVLLLYSENVLIIQRSLYTLINLAQSQQPREALCDTSCVTVLLVFLHNYQPEVKKLAASLLRSLCSEGVAREHVKDYDGVPILLSLLRLENVTILHHVVWVLVQLASDFEISDEIRMLGGIPVLLSLIHHRFPNNVPFQNNDCPRESILSLQQAVCTAITELLINETNSRQIADSNGIYKLSLLILPQETKTSSERLAVENLQMNAFRALRFLFSMERHRQLFKRLFPSQLFEMFIDVGHYKRDTAAYVTLVHKINSCTATENSQMQTRMEDINQEKAPSNHVGKYAVLDMIGRGSFGTVYRVQRKTTFLAMKEISLSAPAFGKSAKDKAASMNLLLIELSMVKEKLVHPNIVRYYNTFTENDCLYIVMELINGAPLGEYCDSLKEKSAFFPEDRIWHIFVQIVLALRYLHEEKRIVHRDLSMYNIMLGDQDKVTITDFGLAKQKHHNSMMKSMVGTILFCCPEVIQHQPYGEKADIWSIGCILYQMCTLEAAFLGTNVLAVAPKIVEAVYAPIPEGMYSAKMIDTVDKCITPNPEWRPNIVQVAGLIADELMKFTDALREKHAILEKKLDKERKRTQRHCLESNRNMQNYQRLFHASLSHQARQDSISSSIGDQVSQLGITEGYISSAGDEETMSPAHSRSSSVDSVNNTNRFRRHRREKSLALNIDGIANRMSDSSLPSSPYPNLPPSIPRAGSGGSKRSRPGSVTLSISQSKLREINDPILTMLTLIHKLVYIAQLPPISTLDPRREVILRLKRNLFSSNVTNLKSDLRRLLNESDDFIDFMEAGRVGKLALKLIHDSSNGNHGDTETFQDSVFHNDNGLTYEQANRIIESVLRETDYYTNSNFC